MKGGRKSTSYEDVIDRMQQMHREDDAIEITPPKGVTLSTFSNRITSLLMRKPVDPPPGLRFSKHNTRRGTVAIVLTSKKGRK